LVPKTRQLLIWAIGVGISFAGSALAQSNLDAGKSAAQIFADTCNACHRSPREIKKTSPAFMREHYTTGMREAVMMANYLASVGSDPQAIQQRKPPVMGAGHAPATEPTTRTAAPATAQPIPNEATRNSAAVPDHAPAASESARSSVAIPPVPSLLRPEPQAAPSPSSPPVTTQNQPKPAPTYISRPRRPSDSLEIGANGWAPGFAPGSASTHARARSSNAANFEE
jgi:hypothetical protein